MYDKLTELIIQQDYNEALYEFQEEHLHIDERSAADAAKLCILEASIWEGLSDSVAMYDALAKACTYDYTNYEIYYMLALYFWDINPDKAYLCMEMALHYCNKEEDMAVIEGSFNELKESGRCKVRNVSIMILSYNGLELLKRCIESVEKHAPAGSFEVVVVDNASTEPGVTEYLRSKRDEGSFPFILIESQENLGFPKGCNLGTANCNPENDIFFLNNDAVLMPNSLLMLRMGLYENRTVGAVSAMSNSASLQEIDMKDFVRQLPDEEKEIISNKENPLPWHKRMETDRAIKLFEEYAVLKCHPMRNPYVKCFRLTGFAVMLSREAVDTVSVDGQVFDEFFSPGYFEDDDLGIRLARAGFDQYLCRNSLIYHNGGDGSFGQSEAMQRGRERFIDKWGFDIWGYSLPWDEACEKVIELAKENGGSLRVLDFSCGFGANASYIKSVFPDVYVAGACMNSFEAGIACRIVDDVIYGDLNCIRIPWKQYSFDVVIAEKKFVCKGQIQRCLKPGGVALEF